ncbi:MAG: hypothetical protein H6732_16730 [Alphaproteobacteria bacterium]|nr:hypothetical protein [Alphaproteobacteria bacterium]
MRGVVLGLLLGACGRGEPCDPVRLVRQAAPADATDCGVGTTDDATIHACLVAAFRAGEPFRGVLSEQVGVGLLARGWLGRADGTVEVFLGDFDTCTDEACFGLVERVACPGPAVTEVGGREQLTCTWDEPPCGEVVCGDPAAGCG